MQSFVSLLSIGFVAAGGCGKKTAAPAGDPLFADEAWKERPAEALQSLGAALGPDWQVTAESVERKSDTRLSLRGVRLASTDGNTVLAFASVEVKGTSQSIDVAGKLKGVGAVNARARTEPAAAEVKVDITAVRVGEGEGWRLSAGGVPLRGSLDGHISVRLPDHSWTKADVSIELRCSDCGTAEGRVQPATPTRGGTASAFAQSGLTLPALTLGDVLLSLQVDKGTGTFSLATAGDPDMEVEIEGDMRLADPLSSSNAKLCASMRFSETARRASPKLDGLMSLISRGGADAGLSMSASGRLDALRFRPVADCN